MAGKPRFLGTEGFPRSEAFLEAVRERKERGSKLVEAALPCGLWDIHLKDLPEFRDFAHAWMHRPVKRGFAMTLSVFSARA